MRKLNYLFLVLTIIACSSTSKDSEMSIAITDNVKLVDTMVVEEPLYCNESTLVGAERVDEYLALLDGKRVGLIANQSSMINETHLVDSLLSLGVNIVKVFSPEHGFRGKADAGEKVENDIDSKTGLSLISLYGKNRKPTKEQLADVDVLVFDIQDVGARFYTYISTLHYVMEAAAEFEKELIILDRPNPNGHYVDGPVLDKNYSSFVGMHEVPVVHGMSIGEYALMINGEGWLGDDLVCDLKVIECEGWDHTKFYELPIAPSPNLPNMMSVYLYPSLCFFEGTIVSIGRGTDYPFQIVGHPAFNPEIQGGELYNFVPKPNEGASHPKLENDTCYGYYFYDDDIKQYREKANLDLSYLIDFFEILNLDKEFFLKTNFINLLAGSEELKNQILSNVSLDEIQKSWASDLEGFKLKRQQYLLYKDFN